MGKAVKDAEWYFNKILTAWINKKQPVEVSEKLGVDVEIIEKIFDILDHEQNDPEWVLRATEDLMALEMNREAFGG